MSDEALRLMLMKAVDLLRGATDLTMDEIIGCEPARVGTQPGRLLLAGHHRGRGGRLGATPREMLEDHDLLTAPKRS